MQKIQVHYLKVQYIIVIFFKKKFIYLLIIYDYLKMYYTVCSKDAIISWEAKSSTPKISALSHWTLKILSIQLARITCLSREQERFLIGEPWTASDLSTCTVYNPEELPEHSWSQVVSYDLWISVFADSLDAFLTWCFSLKYWGFFCILVISCLSLMTDNHSHSLCGGSICSMQKKLLQVPSLKTVYCSNLNVWLALPDVLGGLQLSFAVPQLYHTHPWNHTHISCSATLNVHMSWNMDVI